MGLHEGEIDADTTTVRALLLAQCPQWAELPLEAAGAGTDNLMFRLGEGLLVRLPRTPGHVDALAREQRWLPLLAPHLGVRIPEPLHAGSPAAGYPLPWAVYRWIEGADAAPGLPLDWAAFGTGLAAFVRELRAVPPMGASRAGYRGGSLHERAAAGHRSLDECAAIPGLDLDVATLRRYWEAALATGDPAGPPGWLHGDLRPGNVLVRDGRLHAVIDFGGVGLGFPDAEHAPLWDYPAAAREAYWAATGLDEPTWLRARGWALAVAAAGIPYYRLTFPSFAAECVARLRAVLDA